MPYLNSKGLVLVLLKASLMSWFIHSSWLLANSRVECAMVVRKTMVYDNLCMHISITTLLSLVETSINALRSFIKSLHGHNYLCLTTCHVQHIAEIGYECKIVISAARLPAMHPYALLASSER